MNAQLKSSPTEIDLAAQELRDAKAQEDASRAARISAEEALIALVGVKPEGTTTIKTDYFKISTVGKLTRTLDAGAFEAIASQIPEAFRNRVVRYKPELVTAELRFLDTNEPEIYRLLAQALTVKPAKASVSVDLL